MPVSTIRNYSLVRRYQRQLGYPLEGRSPRGLNFCMSGLPYWTLDIGGFFFVVGTDYTKRGCGCNDNPNPLWVLVWALINGGCEDLGYRELYTRWLEYGVFLTYPFRLTAQILPRDLELREPGSRSMTLLRSLSACVTVFFPLHIL